MKMQRFMAVLIARNKEFLRDRDTLSWNIIFPLVIMLAFAFAFSSNNNDQHNVGVIQLANISNPDFLHLLHIQFIPADNQSLAMAKVARHHLICY